jgi:epoxide hydrolase 4
MMNSDQMARDSQARLGEQDMEHLNLELGRIKLHAATAGHGPLVVLLHGFPEFWYSWRHQLAPLAAAGFHAIAPDMRGYNESAKPRGIHSYAVQELVDDVLALIKRESAGPAYLVGHDWGGVVAWRFAALHPELTRRLVILNAPHPAAYARTLRRSLAQWFKSSYVGLFQIPGLAEFVLRRGDYWLIERALRRTPNTNAFSDEDIARYKAALSVPGALTSALNYYRAALWHPRSVFREPQTIKAPTLVIWGEQDSFLSLDLLQDLERWTPDLRIERIATAGHWVQNEAPEEVNRLLLQFLEERH